MSKNIFNVFRSSKSQNLGVGEETNGFIGEPGVWIKGITFSDGTSVDLRRDDIVVVVGPNNSGKSALLRAIDVKLDDSGKHSTVVKRIRFDKRGTADQVAEWLQRTAKRVSDYGSPAYEALGARVFPYHIEHDWTHSDHIGSLAGFFCRLLDAEGRLQAANPPDSIAIASEAPKHPIHYLQWNDSLESLISQQFRKAFGTGIVVHRNAGKNVPVLVGERPQPEPGQDRVSYEYVMGLDRLPAIHAQGDGIRSFLGILLFALVGHETILLVDEPEAFLHPPQARHLGEVLVSGAAPERQIFVATHSGDVLRGMLNADSNRVRVLRIRREGDINVVNQLDNAQVQQAWSDSLLRYSNILDGLFHERVVLCESDSDCRFYAAVMDAMLEPSSENERRPDILFTHCGGKDRLHLGTGSLRALEVPTSVIVDFDILNSEIAFKRTVVAAGGDWDAISRHWRVVKHAIDQKKPELGADEVKTEIAEVLAGINAVIFPENAKKKIQAVLRRSSPWATAKSVGLGFLPNGQPAQACELLFSALQSIGIFVVPVGEVEGFVKSASGHGPSWVSEVLEMDLKNDSRFAAAKKFVGQVIRSDSVL